MALIHIKRGIYFDENSLQKEFTRSSGPGGQNVNKVETGVRLRLEIDKIIGINNEIKDRLNRIAANKITSDNELLVEAQSQRTQHLNYKEALGKITEIIKEASKKPKTRKKTKPTKASKERRLEEKKQQGEKKKLRQNITKKFRNLK